MQQEELFLAVQVAVDEAAAFHAQGHGVSRGPAHHVGEEVTVIGEVLSSVSTIHVRWKERHPAAPRAL
jgi:hypothetical protein